MVRQSVKAVGQVVGAVFGTGLSDKVEATMKTHPQLVYYR